MSVYNRLSTAVGGRLLTASAQKRKIRTQKEYNIPVGENTRTIYGLIREGEYLECKNILLSKLENFPRNRAALSLLGYVCYMREEYSEACTYYEQLIDVCPKCERYKLFLAQALFKSSKYTEAITQGSKIIQTQTKDEAVLPIVEQANKIVGYSCFESEDLPGAKKARQQGIKDADVLVLKGCILYKEGEVDKAMKQFVKASKLSVRPSIQYNMALCMFRLKNYPEAFKLMEDIIQKGSELHPELGVGVGATTEGGVETRSVGNTLTLKNSALVEAFNLKCALEYSLGNLETAGLALKEMPPRKNEELDAVTLHNVALLQMETDPTEGFKKMKHLLMNPPFPEETFPNLLLLYCKYSYYFHAADVLAANSRFFKYLSPELHDFLEAVIASQTSPEVGYAKLDEIATQHIDKLRKITKKIQDARMNKSPEGIKNALKEYTEGLNDYIPVLMHMARIYWDAENYPEVEKILLQSEEFCAENETWKLNLAHTYFMQEKPEKFGQAIRLYSEIVKKHKTSKLLDVPAMVLANLCVAYIMTSKNELAEDLMKEIEKEESKLSRVNPQKQYLHLCIVNLVIGTLYCSKGHYGFGIQRVIKSLEPYNKKIMTDTWFYAKRCFLSLLEFLCKNMIIIKDTILDDVLTFLDNAAAAGKTISTTVSSVVDSGGADAKSMSYDGGLSKDLENLSIRERSTVYYEARLIKRLFLKHFFG